MENNKETPMKLIAKPNEVFEDELDYICPICGKRYIDRRPYYKYCYNCGQKLDWSDSSED